MPGTSGGQNIQGTVDQLAEITPRSTDAGLGWREVFQNAFPEIIVNFSECHGPMFYLKDHIISGRVRFEV